MNLPNQNINLLIGVLKTIDGVEIELYNDDPIKIEIYYQYRFICYIKLFHLPLEE